VRRGQRSMSPVRAGAIALVLIALGTYFGVRKSVPFRHHYTIEAVFESSNLVKPRSPVRIAGVDVGRVVAVGRYRDTNLALVKMRIDGQGRPVHSDATAKIRPRLFLEGNFYVDLQPGTPAARELADGGLIGVTQTSTPVQLDQVLTALQENTRGSLQQALRGFGDALDAKPTAAQDADQDPSVRGLTGAQAINKTLRTSPQSLRGTALVMDGLTGERPGDLTRTVRGFGRAAAALAERESDLKDFVRDFDTTLATTAAHAADLRAIVQRLGPTARSARGAFARLSSALPPTRRFAVALAGSLPEVQPTIRASKPWLAQAEQLLGDAELGGLLDELAPATADLATLGHATRVWLPRIDAFNRCITGVILPTGNVKVDDGPLSAGVENYKEFWTAMVGQAGEGQSFDGNGPLLRIQAAGGAQTITTGKTNYSGRSLVANTAVTPQRTRPAYANRLPPLRRDVPCYRNPVPDVNGPAATGPADGSRPNAPAPSAAAVAPAPATGARR
jgi:phospholipid/cholesterol/gamma-HCH transport system substrate-binding protein